MQYDVGPYKKGKCGHRQGEYSVKIGVILSSVQKLPEAKRGTRNRPSPVGEHRTQSESL